MQSTGAVNTIHQVVLTIHGKWSPTLSCHSSLPSRLYQIPIHTTVGNTQRSFPAKGPLASNQQPSGPQTSALNTTLHVSHHRKGSRENSLRAERPSYIRYTFINSFFLYRIRINFIACLHWMQYIEAVAAKVKNTDLLHILFVKDVFEETESSNSLHGNCTVIISTA